MSVATIGDERFSDKVEPWATTVLGIKVPSVVKSFSTPITPYKYLSIGENVLYNYIFPTSLIFFKLLIIMFITVFFILQLLMT